MVYDPAAFPNLTANNHQQIGPPKDDTYNCIAWAAGFNDRRLDPTDDWPWPAPRNTHRTTLVKVFKSFGFVKCADGLLEHGFEKIVIYVENNDPYKWTHAARQLTDGRWTSKLGDYERINHDAPDNLVGPEYGQIWRYMKRDVSTFLFPLGVRSYVESTQN